MGDVNGDGYADAIMSGPYINNGPSLAIMYGNSAGQLAQPVVTPGLSVGLPVIGDVNGDGHPDIVSAVSNPSNEVSVLINDGKGSFSQASTIPFVGDFPGSLYLVDVDGDGKLDLLLSVKDPVAIYYFKNLGGGSFAPPVTLASPTGIGANRTFAVGDFNGDGRPDIVYSVLNSSTGQDQIHLFINQGGGSFVDQIPAGVTGEAGYFVVGDFNNDGNLDIAVQPETSFTSLPSASISVFLGRGDGTFTAGPTTTFEINSFQTYQFVVGDFDHDGNLDLAGVNGDTEPGKVMYLWGDGAGNFKAQAIVGPAGFSVVAGNVNGDGIPDVIADLVGVILGQNKSRNLPSGVAFTPTSAGNVSVADIDGDQKPDLLVPGYSNFIPGTVYINQGDGKFVWEGSPPGEGLFLADLDGDGLAEMIGTDGNNILIWKGTGDPNFSAAPIVVTTPIGVGNELNQLQIADMDGDGRLDLVLPGLILYNEGNFNFTPVSLNFIVSSNYPFVVGDFNKNGRPDIVTSAYTLVNQGNRTFQAVPNNLTVEAGETLAVGDFNQDGVPDIVASGNEAGVNVFYGKGDGTFFLQSGLDVGPSDFSQALAVTDVNGDGRPDIVACLFFSLQCVVFTNDGQGGFVRSLFASGTNAVSIVSSDLNGDGKPDLVITNYVLDYRPPNFNIFFHQ